MDHRWSDKSDAWIEIWSLLEVKLSSRIGLKIELI